MKWSLKWLRCPWHIVVHNPRLSGINCDVRLRRCSSVARLTHGVHIAERQLNFRRHGTLRRGTGTEGQRPLSI